MTNVKTCEECPLNSYGTGYISGMSINGPRECEHPEVKSREIKTDNVPKWCPLRKKAYHEEKMVNGKKISERTIKLDL